MIEEIKKMNKIELHIHLDGSLCIDTVGKITGLNKNELSSLMIADEKLENLSEYLVKFDLPIKCMQTKENLRLMSKELVNYLERENVIYSEIRFAPLFHTRNNLTLEEVIESVLDGLRSNDNVKTNLILCMMRGMTEEDNLKVIDVAQKYLKRGVCAVDLAGAEDKYPLKDYVNLFNYAKENNVPFIIHAGENGSYKEVRLAINLGAKRIGHGIHSYESVDFLNELKNKDILLEICPTSNIQTNAIDEYSKHPIYDFYKRGIKVCVNTDNKTVSNITLNEEYIKLYNTFNFSIEDFKNMNLNAIKYSFLSDEEKQILIEKIK